MATNMEMYPHPRIERIGKDYECHNNKNRQQKKKKIKSHRKVHEVEANQIHG